MVLDAHNTDIKSDRHEILNQFKLDFTSGVNIFGAGQEESLVLAPGVQLTATIIPVVHSIKKKVLFLRYINLAFSLFILFFIVEVIGVMFGYWYFPGTDYLGLITIFNQTFPIEEIIFWMFFYPATIASYYEEFIDDYF